MRTSPTSILVAVAFGPLGCVEPSYVVFREDGPESDGWIALPEVGEVASGWRIHAGVCSGRGFVLQQDETGTYGSAITNFMQTGEATPTGRSYVGEWNNGVELWGDADASCALGPANVNALHVACWLSVYEPSCEDASAPPPPLRFGGERRWENAIWECP